MGMSDGKVFPFEKFNDKLIEKEVEKALENDDEIIVTVKLDNGLQFYLNQFFLSLEDDEDDPA
jgi:AAA+ ATPase superfamily predicted ATPase